MFEVRYKKDDEWFTLDAKHSVEMCHGEELADPSYVLGVGISIKPSDIPQDAEEVYCFYHFTDGEDVEEDE